MLRCETFNRDHENVDSGQMSMVPFVFTGNLTNDQYTS